MDVIKISSVPSVGLIRSDDDNESSGERRDATSTSRVPLAPDQALSTVYGSLHLTPHHLIFKQVEKEELWIPLPLLYSVTRMPSDLTGTFHPLVLRTRDFKVYEFIFTHSDEAEGVWDSLKGLSSSFSQASLQDLYAFKHGENAKVLPSNHQPDPVSSISSNKKGKGKAGWGLYQPEKEFGRMGIGSRSKAWRFTEINDDFEFCPSYPARIVVPAKISDTTLGYAVKYRSKGRIPGLVYLHWANLGSITRSSQPLVGLKPGSRSIQDEKLIECIFGSHSQHSSGMPQPRHSFALAHPSSSVDGGSSGQVVFGAQATNLIIDARPTKNAMANSLKGAGSENMDYYRNCKKAYLGIDNIHVMRSSLNGVFDILEESESIGFVDRMALKRTHWLKHLSNILEGILIITRTIHLSNSHVLVHCSDGWDRTSQLSSIAQLCLDPFYRTAEGFAVLIEKDWLSYGHRFADRSGHLCGDKTEFISTAGDSSSGLSAQSSFLATVQKQFTGSSHAYKETCPVFQQFLDCIYQIMVQFPERFEFNEKMLRKLQWETYAGRSGTFLFNSEKDRAQFEAKRTTESVWDELFDLVEEEEKVEWILMKEYKNPSYDHSLDDSNSRAADADQGVLMIDPKQVRWWFELFDKGDEEMNGSPLEASLANVMFDSTLEESEGEGVAKVTVVENKADDPVLSATAVDKTRLSTKSNPAPARPVSIGDPVHSRSNSPALQGGGIGRSSSPMYSNGQAPLALPSQAQLVDAVSSVQKFGWGAWGKIQKGYQDAVTQYNDQQERQKQSEQQQQQVEQSNPSADITSSSIPSLEERIQKIGIRSSEMNQLDTSSGSAVSNPATYQPYQRKENRDFRYQQGTLSDLSGDLKSMGSSNKPQTLPLPPPTTSFSTPISPDTGRQTNGKRLHDLQLLNPVPPQPTTSTLHVDPSVSLPSVAVDATKKNPELDVKDVDPLGVGFSSLQ